MADNETIYAPAEVVTTVLSSPRLPTGCFVAESMPVGGELLADCNECENGGVVVEGIYGGKVVHVSGCPECGRGE
jgi:hypothetical protein